MVSFWEGGVCLCVRDARDVQMSTQKLFLSGTAHCADMYGASSLDSVYLTNARQKISDVLDGWLKAK